MRPQRRFHGMRSVTGVPGAMLLAVVSLLDLDALQAFETMPRLREYSASVAAG